VLRTECLLRGHSRRRWHVRGMFGFGVISEVPVESKRHSVGHSAAVSGVLGLAGASK
jgi:hypothetical protein